MARNDFRIEGMDQLIGMLRTFEKSPQRVANKSARAGARIAWKAARVNAPKRKGNLRKGIIMRVEKNKKRGKKMLDIKMSAKPQYSAIFVKRSPGTRDGRAYYPASQEYGWRLRGSNVKKDGRHYLKNALKDNEGEISRTIVKVAIDEFEKIMRG